MRRVIVRLIGLVAILGLLSAQTAAADNVKNDVAIGGVGQKRTIPEGGSTTVNYLIERTGGRCDAADGTPATLTFSSRQLPGGTAARINSTTSPVRVSPASLVISACEFPQPAVFSASHAGRYEITVGVTDANAPDTYNTSPATFILEVLSPNRAPDVSITAPDAKGTEGDTLQTSGSFIDPDGDALTLTKPAGSPGTLAVAGNSWTWSLDTDDDASGTVTVTARDPSGASVSDTFSYSATNANPSATINGAPATGPEGTQIDLTSTVADRGSADTHTYDWSVTRNGASVASGTSASFSFTPGDNGIYVVTVSVTDDDGGTGSDSKTIQVTNVAPSATLSVAPDHLTEGGSAVVSFSAQDDPSSADLASLRYAFACDGGSLAGATYAGASASSSTTCTFDDGPASDSVRARIIDKDGGFNEYVTVVQVANAAPTATFNAPSPVDEGSPIHLSLSGPHDPSSADTTAGFDYAFDCGSGFGAFGAASMDSCATTDDEVRTVGGKIRDKDLDSTAYSASVTVLNVAPRATINGAPATSPEGTRIALTSSVTDPGSADAHTYAWSVTKNGNPYASGTNANFAFTPDDDGSYLVMLVVRDDDGGVGSDSQSINVTNVDPTAAINGAPASSPEGTPINLTSTVTDPGADTHSYDWSVTRGTEAVASGHAANFSFTPDDNGTYVVTLSVTDDDGGTGSDRTSIVITNVDPTADFNATNPVDEGSPIALSLTNPHDPSAADTAHGFGYSFDCGSGLGGASSSNDATCVTSDNGIIPVRGRIEDKDGGSTTYSRSVTVNNVAPTINDFSISAPSGAACATNRVSVSFTVFDPASEANDAITGTINWGDGSTSAISGRNVSATHSYAPGSYGLRVSVDDGDGGVATAGAAPGVKNVNLFYATSGLLQPINTTGDRSGFKIGSTIPVKVRITDCTGASVGTLAPRVSLTKIDSKPDVAVNEVVSSSAADTGTTMRYAASELMYIYNLSTKRSQFCPSSMCTSGGDLTQGTYRVMVSHAAITPVSALIDLRL